MKNYAKESALVLATCKMGMSVYALLLVNEPCGVEYVTGNCFKCTDDGYRMQDFYHYGDDVVHAVDHWKRLCGFDGPERFMCPNEECSGMYQEHPIELVYEDGCWTCPKCGCSTSFPEDDACIRIGYDEEV